MLHPKSQNRLSSWCRFEWIQYAYSLKCFLAHFIAEQLPSGLWLSLHRQRSLSIACGWWNHSRYLPRRGRIRGFPLWLCRSWWGWWTRILAEYLATSPCGTWWVLGSRRVGWSVWSHRNGETALWGMGHLVGMRCTWRFKYFELLFVGFFGVIESLELDGHFQTEWVSLFVSFRSFQDQHFDKMHFRGQYGNRKLTTLRKICSDDQNRHCGWFCPRLKVAFRKKIK